MRVIICLWEDLPDDVPDEPGGFDEWSFGRGGDGLPDGTWHLHKVVEEEGRIVDYIYPFPPCVQYVIKQIKEGEREKVKSEIRRALGL